MPIKIPEQLPALSVLADENIFVMSERRALSQDIRPMKLAILNLMPNKIATEIQILRLLANTPLQIHVDFVRIHANASRHTPQAHMDTFYRSFDTVKQQQYDGLIITGAPLALLDHTEVRFWDDICQLFDWAQQNVTSTLFSCWAAHAALFHYHGIKRQLRKQKLSGVYRHQPLDPAEPLTRGFDEVFSVPHSRYGFVDQADYQRIAGLNILAQSDQAGVYLAASDNKCQVYLTGHPEYDADTLHREYLRDNVAGAVSRLPENYYPGNDSSKKPANNWRSHGSLLFSNWLNYYVYQITPYQLDDG